MDLKQRQAALRDRRIRLQAAALQLERCEQDGCVPDHVLIEIDNAVRDLQTLRWPERRGGTPQRPEKIPPLSVLLVSESRGASVEVRFVVGGDPAMFRGLAADEIRFEQFPAVRSIEELGVIQGLLETVKPALASAPAGRPLADWLRDNGVKRLRKSKT